MPLLRRRSAWPRSAGPCSAPGRQIWWQHTAKSCHMSQDHHTSHSGFFGLWLRWCWTHYRIQIWYKASLFTAASMGTYRTNTQRMWQSILFFLLFCFCCLFFSVHVLSVCLSLKWELTATLLCPLSVWGWMSTGLFQGHSVSPSLPSRDPGPSERPTHHKPRRPAQSCDGPTAKPQGIDEDRSEVRAGGRRAVRSAINLTNTTATGQG